MPSYYVERPSGTNNPSWPCTNVDYVGQSCIAPQVPTGGKFICVAGPQHVIKGCYNPNTNQYQRVSIGPVTQAPPVPTDTPAPLYSSFEDWYSEFKSYIGAGGNQLSLSTLEEWRNDTPPLP